MRKWITMLLLGILFLSSFQTVKAEATQTTNQVPTTCQSCSCVDVEALLSQVLVNISTLSFEIEQKNAELQKLYMGWNTTKNVSILSEIVRIEDEVRVLTNKLKFLERQKLSIELIKKYTIKTPYGIKILYYKLPSESALVQEYMEKVHPVRTDVDLTWFIAYYRQAAELTFTEYVQTDMRLRELLKIVNSGNYTQEHVREILDLLEQRRMLWNEIYSYAEEKEKLETIQALKEAGWKQTLVASAIGIEPLAINFGGIAEGESCFSIFCNWNYGYKDPLPGVDDPKYADSAPLVHYSSFYPVAVWVGIYESTTPNKDYFWGQYCTYDFPQTNTDFRKYWDRAVDLHPGTQFQDFGSIQIKLFYDGWAYNPNEGNQLQESNIIWQVECNKSGCWVVTNYLKPLPDPDAAYYADKYYKLYVNKYWLECCKYGDVGSSCKWANTHCGGCFAPDQARSQNFVVCTRDTYGSLCGWDWVVKW
ncbi:hypothetical protein TON_0229 [Thermococcus onnurineus NA1]|uniref:Uncharacterized protein n=1 Tax=Thermococcus onnurineus (strain NA1) TaxID=523850 RepID=B6YT27_THEON|nr:hypothetical protein [Thermococcus onnurineus]ACJ15714.1 hypothetical protein TON_0229 [Thermococcus onnurineus NA1]